MTVSIASAFENSRKHNKMWTTFKPSSELSFGSNDHLSLFDYQKARRGMGGVYLAQDTKLDRKIALKLLPTEFVNDEARLRRFVQEAKAAELRT